MHKIKVAIKSLRDHLHRDSQGIKLLDDVARIANELRTEVRCLSEQCASLEDAATGLREELADSKLSLEDRTADLSRSRQIQRRLDRKIEVLEEEKRSLELQLDPQLDDSRIPPKELPGIQQFITTFKSLRSLMSVPPAPCPRPIARLRYSFELTDFIDFKKPDYARLGMFVSVLCLLDWSVTFAADEKMNPVSLGKDKKCGGEIGKMLRWVKREWFAKDAEWKERILDNSNYAQDRIDSKF